MDRITISLMFIQRDFGIAGRTAFQESLLVISLNQRATLGYLVSFVRKSYPIGASCEPEGQKNRSTNVRLYQSDKVSKWP